MGTSGRAGLRRRGSGPARDPVRDDPANSPKRRSMVQVASWNRPSHYIRSTRRDWMATSASPEYKTDLPWLCADRTDARRIAAEVVGEQACAQRQCARQWRWQDQAFLVHSLCGSSSYQQNRTVSCSTSVHSLLNAAPPSTSPDAAEPEDPPATVRGNFLELPRLPMMVSPQRGRKQLYTMLGYTLVNPERRAAGFHDTLSCCAGRSVFIATRLDGGIRMTDVTIGKALLKARSGVQGENAPLARRGLRHHSAELRRCRRGKLSWERRAARRLIPRQLRIRRHRDGRDANRRADRRFLMWRGRRCRSAATVRRFAKSAGTPLTHRPQPRQDQDDVAAVYFKTIVWGRFAGIPAQSSVSKPGFRHPCRALTR